MAERATATSKKPEAKQTCSNSCKQNIGFNSSGSTADRILQLQRTAGNQAVQRLIKSGSLHTTLNYENKKGIPFHTKSLEAIPSKIQGNKLQTREEDTHSTSEPVELVTQNKQQDEKQPVPKMPANSSSTKKSLGDLADTSISQKTSKEPAPSSENSVENAQYEESVSDLHTKVRSDKPILATLKLPSSTTGESSQTRSRELTSAGRQKVSTIEANSSKISTRTEAKEPQVGVSSRISSEPTDNIDSISPEYIVLVQELATQRMLLFANAEQQKVQITNSAGQQKTSIQKIAEAEALSVENAYDQVIESIQKTSEIHRKSIYSTLEAESNKVNKDADAEIALLEATIAAKKTAVINKGKEKSDRINQFGKNEAKRAQQGSIERGQRAEQLGNQKAVQYSNKERGAEIASKIRIEVPKMVSKFLQTGNEIATGVLEKTVEIVSHFNQEAGEIAEKFDKPYDGAREQILKKRDKTLETLQKMADEAAKKLDEEANDLAQKLSKDKSSKAAQIRDLAPNLSASFDKNVTPIMVKIDSLVTTVAEELSIFAEKVKEGGWYQPFVLDARADVLAALTAQKTEQQGFVTQVISNFEKVTSSAQDNIKEQAQTIISAVEQVGNTFKTNASKIANDINEKMKEAAGKGEESIKVVTPLVENKLQEAVDKSDSEWEKQLSEKSSEISKTVNGALTKEDNALSKFITDIDLRAERAATNSVLGSIWDFIAGVFEGIGLDAWELLKGLWEVIKSPLFWIIVAIAAVVVIIAVLIFGFAAVLAAIVVVLKYAIIALVVLGIIAGLIAAGYFIYQMFTKPNLSWRERGRLLGKAIFELIMAFVGTGILKRLGVFLKLGRLISFVKSVGSITKALRLINKLPDLEKLFVLMNKVGDADKLIVLFNKMGVGNAEKLLPLLEKVKDADKLGILLDKVGNASTLLKLLENPKLANVAELELLLENTKISKAADLINLLSNAKITKAAELEKLLGNAKISNAEELVNLLNNAKITKAAELEKLLGNAKLASAAELEKLLGNAKISNAEELVNLLNNSKITKAAELEKLLGNAKLATAAELKRLLSNTKLVDVAQLERLLGDAKLVDAAQLERLLGDAKLADAAQLERLLANVDKGKRLESLLAMADDGLQLESFLTKAGGSSQAKNLEELMKLANANGPGQATRLNKLLDIAAGNASEFAKFVKWAKRLSRRSNPAPTIAPPPEVSYYGFSGANMQHFLDAHTWEYIDIGKRLANKKWPVTSFWPPDTNSPSTVRAALSKALRNLNKPGKPRLPDPSHVEITSGGNYTVQIGSRTPPTPSVIGQFFPTSPQSGIVSMSRDLLTAIWDILK